MAAGRKLYIEIANSFKAVVETHTAGDAWDTGARSAVSNLAKLISRDFKTDNSSFDYDKFFEACGLGPNGELKDV